MARGCQSCRQGAGGLGRSSGAWSTQRKQLIPRDVGTAWGPAPCSLEMLHTEYLAINWGDGLPFPSLNAIFQDTFLALLEAGCPCVLCVPRTEPLINPSPGSVWCCPGRGDSTTCTPVPSHLVFLLQGKEMLTQKLPLWQQSCSDPNKIPERAIQLMQQMAASSNGTIMPSPLSTSKSNLIISDPIPGAKPLPVPPELAPFVGVSISVLEAVLPF